MQYVRSLSGSVSKTWNSINPATLSGAIDVIVVEQEDGSLACSPFHVRFGKFSLLRPYEKKVEFRVNDERRDFPMKLGEGGEAFFVFETTSSVPEALQTSPLVSPATSPHVRASPSSTSLNEPPAFELDPQSDTDALSIPDDPNKQHSKSLGDIEQSFNDQRAQSDMGYPAMPPARLGRAVTDDVLPAAKAAIEQSITASGNYPAVEAAMSTRPAPTSRTDRSASPPPMSSEDAMTRAINLSKKLWTSNIASQVTEKGDIMLDMTGYKSSEDEALRAEVVARKILSEELEGDYDIGSLIGADENGNLWIYGSEEARDKANAKAANAMGTLQHAGFTSADNLSDPGYASDDARSQVSAPYMSSQLRRDSDSALGSSPPTTSADTPTAGDPNRNYAKTLRLTSDQLHSLNLKSGANSMSFSVNRATCTANIYRWKYDVPIVISDIDGTITKSDALGHVLNMIGRDWTHLGVAKLYTDIAANGYNLLYLTSRSVGQADTTRGYLRGVVQDGGFRLPKGPVIMSPDRTMAALRREVYLRKPEVFKMACLRDIMALFTGSGGSNNAATAGPTTSKDAVNGLVGGSRGRGGSPFYAGFGNRLTDALSYRSVNIPSTRIFTINSNAEVSLDLLTLNKYKTGYVSMREIVDHYFPPVSLLVKGGGEEFTDFNYWREKTLDLADFSDSESDSDDDDDDGRYDQSRRSSEDEGDAMGESYLSEARTRDSEVENLEESIMESVEDPDDYIHDDGDEEEREVDEDEEYDEEEEDMGPIRAESIVASPRSIRSRTSSSATPQR
ncbi:hypothetical protein AAFC00_003040 [Neodothiora populina]|uniref:LNS2/PITP domain-containing protein n=1 Tax=Neodothiora populina TaxID=2781224 RepID=A0ABR3PAF5_9PEZI